MKLKTEPLPQDRSQYCPQTIQWTFNNTVHRSFNGHLTILSTHTVQWTFNNTVHRLFNGYLTTLSIDYSMDI